MTTSDGKRRTTNKKGNVAQTTCRLGQVCFSLFVFLFLTNDLFISLQIHYLQRPQDTSNNVSTSRQWPDTTTIRHQPPTTTSLTPTRPRPPRHQNEPKRCISCRLGLKVCFFFLLFFFPFFYILTNDILYLSEIYVRVGSDYQNGPKQRVSRRLGFRYVFFFMFFYLLTNQLYYILFIFGLCSGGQRLPKRTQTTCLTSFGLQVCFFHVFYLLTKYIIFIFGLCSGRQRVPKWAQMLRDTSFKVQVRFFLFFMFFFCILTNDLYYIQVQFMFSWALITKTGPNDASCVVWALGIFFFHVFIC